MSKNKANKYLSSLNIEEDKAEKKLAYVIDNGYSYTTYTSWVMKNFPKYLKKFKGNTPENFKTYEILGSAIHGGIMGNRMLYLIQDKISKEVFIIEKTGIKEE